MPYKDKEKQLEYQRNWMRSRRASFFEGKVCVKCNAKKRLELDHIDPTTKVSHAVWSWKEERREKELLKCQVLCYDCHKEKTKKQLGNHGVSMYKKGCRCEICRWGKKYENRKYGNRKEKLGYNEWMISKFPNYKQSKGLLVKK